MSILSIFTLSVSMVRGNIPNTDTINKCLNSCPKLNSLKTAIQKNESFRDNLLVNRKSSKSLTPVEIQLLNKNFDQHFALISSIPKTKQACTKNCVLNEWLEIRNTCLENCPRVQGLKNTMKTKGDLIDKHLEDLVAKASHRKLTPDEEVELNKLVKSYQALVETLKKTEHSCVHNCNKAISFLSKNPIVPSKKAKLKT